MACCHSAIEASRESERTQITIDIQIWSYESYSKPTMTWSGIDGLFTQARIRSQLPRGAAASYPNPTLTLSGSLRRFVHTRNRVCWVGTVASSNFCQSTVETTRVRVGVDNIPSKAGLSLSLISAAGPIVISVLPSISARQHTATHESVDTIPAVRAMRSGSGTTPPSTSLMNMREFGGAILTLLVVIGAP
jgi:hypothetical protein